MKREDKNILIIQTIRLYWNKKVRGAPYSSIRNQWQKAYPLPSNFFEFFGDGNLEHEIYLEQNQSGIIKIESRRKIRKQEKNIQISGIKVLKKQNQYEVIYCSNLQGGNPIRKKYDKQKHSYIALNETAMNLEENEYGRIIYNGRYTTWDEMYYRMDVINLIYIKKKDGSCDIFQVREPDKIYKQIAKLY